MNNYTVYAHINKINHKAYVGMTCQKPTNRWKNGKGYSNLDFCDDIKKYGWDCFEHIIVKSNMSEIEAKELEKAIIKVFDLMNPINGYNKTVGGDKAGMKDKHQNEKTRMKISDARKKRGFTKEHCQHISESKKGTNHHFAKKVYQYKKNGDFVKEWSYMNEASKTLNICKSSISSCCLGLRQSAGGYVWSYERRE